MPDQGRPHVNNGSEKTEIHLCEQRSYHAAAGSRRRTWQTSKSNGLGGTTTTPGMMLKLENNWLGGIASHLSVFVSEGLRRSLVQWRGYIHVVRSGTFQ